MDVSDLRMRIIRALDEGRKDASVRRTAVDTARTDFTTFLDVIAVPMMRQAVQVLRAEGHAFSVHTPAESVRLVNDQAPETFLELVLQVAGDRPTIVGRVSVTRGRQGVLLEEREVAPSKPIAGVEDSDVAQFLVSEVAKLVLKR